MKQFIQKIIEEEIVISKTVSRPENAIYEFAQDGDFLCYPQKQMPNMFSADFLGFSPFKRTYSNYNCGKSKNTALLENFITQFLQTQDTFITGSYEGLCVEIFEDLLNKDDIILYDSAISPWLRKGVKICDAEKKRFIHNDLETLENFLKLSLLNRLRVIVTDGIFYDSGQCADLNAIRLLAEKYDAIVIIDDSLGFLTCGKKGHGADEISGVKNFQDLKIVNMQNTLSCSTGVFVSGDKNLIELLRLRSKSLKYSVSVDEESLIRALKILKDNSQQREKLKQNTLKLYEKLCNLGFKPNLPVSSIVSFSTPKPIEEVKGILEDNFLCATFYKIGKNTLVSFKISESCNL